MCFSCMCYPRQIHYDNLCSWKRRAMGVLEMFRLTFDEGSKDNVSHRWNPGNSSAAYVDSCVKPPVKICPSHFTFNFFLLRCKVKIVLRVTVHFSPPWLMQLFT